MAWTRDNSLDNLEQKEIMIKAIALVHESERFAIRFTGGEHNCDVYFLPRGDIIAGNVNIGYASKLMGRLLPLLDDLDKCNTNERGDGFYAGVDDDVRDRLQSAMMKAWDEHVMNNKWRCG